MKTKIEFILSFFLILALSYSGKSHATHVMGADITYKTLGSLKYEITIDVYRDCRGVPLANMATSIRNAAGTVKFNLSLTRISITDITPTCDTVTGFCNPVNTSSTGSGVEKHTFRDTIDLNMAPYDTLSGFDKFIIETGQCCRNSAISTGADNTMFFTYAEVYIDSKVSNKSPQFYEMPFSILGVDKAFSRNYGGFDSDGDSLVFESVDPVSAYGTPIAYNSSFSKNKPFTVYEPAGVPSPNPYANPPIGFHLDKQTGFVAFTPTKNGEVSLIAMEVREYRKGKLLSITRREMQFWVMASPQEYHTMSAPKEICVVEGDSLSFFVSTTDTADLTGPGHTVKAWDSVFLRWDYQMVNANFKIKDSLWQAGTFSWRTKLGDAKTEPYVLTFSAEDNSCPLKATVQRNVLVHVIKAVQQPRLDFSFDVENDTSYFTNTSNEGDSITSTTWYIDGKKVSTSRDYSVYLDLDSVYTAKMVVTHQITDRCGTVHQFTDSVERKVNPKSCYAKYVIGIDTNQTSKFRVYLINVSTGRDSSRWYFSDGDSITGTGAYRFQKFGKYEVCLKIWNKNCVDTYCDSVGMDSSGKLYKAEGFTVVLQEDDNVGLEELPKPMETQIYPVPFNERLTISIPKEQIEELWLYDIRGQLKLNVSNVNQNKQIVETSHLAEGMYVLRLVTESGRVTTQKVIKTIK